MADNTYYSEYVRDMFHNTPTADDDARILSNFGSLHAACGLAGEAGEVLDLFKKWIFTQKKYDRDALIKELGDVEFYLQALRNELKITRDEILDANMLKLAARHPEGFENSNYYTGDK